MPIRTREGGLRFGRPAPGRRTDTQASPAGLTRGSIALRKKLFAKKMDGRVKPGHDGYFVGQFF
jgi:hypothetical protein